MNPAAAFTSTPTGAITRYKRIIGGRLYAGIRLHPRKLSIRTLRANLINLLGSFKKRFFSKTVVAPRASSSSSPSCVSTPSMSIGRRGGASKTKISVNTVVRIRSSTRQPSIECNCRLKSLRRTNSFYAEAIADCLEFIKRSSAIDARTDHQEPTSAPLALVN